MAIHIYVVDDDSANLHVADHILRKNDMEVTALSSGRALLDSIRADALPDLILLDIMMPEMDGFETLKLLRSMEKEHGIAEIPVIFLTADETADTEKQGFEAGVSDYIRKPFDPDILLRRVHNIISKEKRLSSLRTVADTDQLTGFLNKAAAGRVMSALCASDIGCLLMIDLDSFKLVNDLYGHKTGDHVLISFAEILRSTLPEGSQIGRIGGDEFLAFVSGIQTANAISVLTKRINSELVARAKKLMGEDMDIPLGASVGAVCVPMHGDDYEMLFHLADKELYKVKQNGKHGFSLYQSEEDAAKTLETSAQSIGKLSEILGERTIPNVALQLDKESFTYVYRYIMRYMLRNQQCLYKVLFTLGAEEGVEERGFQDLCDAFGNHIRESLRKSDILMRSRFNQYFVLLTDIREQDLGIVIGNIMNGWQRSGFSGLTVSYEAEFVHIADRRAKPGAPLRLAMADADEAALRNVGSALSKAGFHVAAVKSAKALLKYLTEHPTDLVLLDSALPDADVFDAVTQIHGLPHMSTVSVLLMSDSIGEDFVRKGLEHGAEDFVCKPVVPELLAHRIRRITVHREQRHDPHEGK